MRDDTPLPSFVPTSRRTVLLEWHLRGLDLEVEVRAPGRLHVVFEDSCNGIEWESELTSDLTRLVDCIAQLTANCGVRAGMAHQEFTDDASIPDEADLWRRVPPGHVIFDSNVGRKRPSKAAFDDHKDGSPMSVVLADLVLQSGRTPQHIVAGHHQFALAAFSVGLARSKQQGVATTP